jgi:predicted PurR-regulated permease PerM
MKQDAPPAKDVRAAPRIGVWFWSFVGFVAATAIVVVALGAVSEIVLRLVFAAVLAVIFKSIARKLERRGLSPATPSGVLEREAFSSS